MLRSHDPASSPVTTVIHPAEFARLIAPYTFPVFWCVQLLHVGAASPASSRRGLPTASLASSWPRLFSFATGGRSYNEGWRGLPAIHALHVSCFLVRSTAACRSGLDRQLPARSTDAIPGVVLAAIVFIRDRRALLQRGGARPPSNTRATRFLF